MSRDVDRSSVPAVVRDLVEGKLGLNQVPTELGADSAAEARRRAVEEIHGVSLDHIGRYSLDAERASTKHCENFIGAAQVPMGIVGPLLLRDGSSEFEVSVPMATTEGALLASTNRGCRAIHRAGGATVHVEDIGMTRAPVFRTESGTETQRFLSWVREHEAEIREVAERTSRYLRLIEIRPSAIGTTVFLRFRFATGDAMGMNMATIA